MNNVRPIGFRGTIFAALVASVLLAANAQAGEAEGLHYDERAAGTATYFAAISNLANAIMFSGLGEELIVSPYERDDWLRRTRFPWTRNWLNRGVQGNRVRLTFFFNGVGVPLATTGIVHPSWAMIAMAASVSAVLANSFGGRLLRPRPADPSAATVPSTKKRTAKIATSGARVDELVFSVPGIHCAGCVNNIHLYLKTASAVEVVEGDDKAKRVRVSFRADAISRDQLQKMFREIGYEASVVPSGSNP